MLDLPVVFLVGLLGSAHCVGMCGGFMAALAFGRDDVHARQACYLTGKTASYMALGALAGAAGGLFGVVLAGFEGLLSVVLGLVILAAGLGLCGVFRRLGPTPFGQWVASRFAAPLGRLVASERRGALVGLGALNGLLPCGLVYAVLAKAALTGNALGGALTLGVFGLGTVPALYASGWLASRLSPLRRLRLQRLGGVLVVALGLLTLARAAVALSLIEAPAGGVAHSLLCVPVN